MMGLWLSQVRDEEPITSRPKGTKRTSEKTFSIPKEIRPFLAIAL